MKLSENLSLSEVLRSSMADRLGIDNTFDSEQNLENMKSVAHDIFQPCRDNLGPIRVSSGYRSLQLNKRIKGSPRSQHCKGEALDLQGLKASNAEIFHYIRTHLPFDQLIWEFGSDEEPHWVHVSHKREGTNRGIVLKSVKKNGEVSYSEM